MSDAMVPNEDNDLGSRLLNAVKALAISSQDASELVDGYFEQSRRHHPGASEAEHQTRVARQIVVRYSRLAGASGGLTALTGVVPGVGTIVAALGGGMADAVVCMKLQVDMCTCLAKAFQWDLHSEDTKALIFLLAAGTAVENFGKVGAVKIGSKAGVELLKGNLKGATLLLLKQLLKKFGIIFTRKALERAIPFGVGVVLGSGAGYALTKYVGREATKWFLLELDGRPEPAA
jgi:hypothetical protein